MDGALIKKNNKIMFFLKLQFGHLWIGLPDIRLIFCLKGYCFEIEHAIDAT